MSTPAYEQLERFPVYLYDTVIEDTMAVTRATKKGSEAVENCINNQKQVRELRRLGLGGLSSSVEIVPVYEAGDIDGQLRLLG
jgi:hypothetical protein